MVDFYNFCVLLESRGDGFGSRYRSSMTAWQNSQTDLYNSLRAELMPTLRRHGRAEADEAFQYVMAKLFSGELKAGPEENLKELVRQRVQMRMMQLKRNNRAWDRRNSSGPLERPVDSPDNLASRGESMERLKAEIEDIVNSGGGPEAKKRHGNSKNTMGAVFCAAMGMKCRMDDKRVELPADMAWGQVYKAMKDGFSHKIDMDALLRTLRKDYGVSLTKGSLSWYIWKFRKELAGRLGITADSGYEDKSGKQRLGRLSSGEFSLSSKD